MRNIVVILVLLFFFKCSPKEEKLQKSDNLHNIEIKEAFNREKKIGLSEFSKGVEYIPLETNDNCLIDRTPQIYANDLHIISVSFRQIFVFERQTGRFIREIGKFGNGPGEYGYTVLDSFNPQRNVINAKTMNKTIIEYNIDGSIDRQIDSPTYITGIFLEINTDVYIGYVPNWRGDIDKKLVVFDIHGKEKIIFENKDIYIKEDIGTTTSFGLEAKFYQYSDSIFFKEIFNDTIFSVSTNTLQPKYVFHTDGLSIDFAIKGKQKPFEEFTNSMVIQDIFECEKFLFFSISYKKLKYSGYYNKITRETQVNNYQDDCDNGFYDDLNNNNSYEIIPQRINIKNEIIGLVEPSSVVKSTQEKSENGSLLSKEKSNKILNSNPTVAIIRTN